jgi:hypothetical protein
MKTIIEQFYQNIAATFPIGDAVRAHFDSQKAIWLEKEKEFIEQAIAEREEKQWDNDIDIAYLTGVFNVVGLDGLDKEIERLKTIGKHPHDIFNGLRELPKSPQGGGTEL